MKTMHKKGQAGFALLTLAVSSLLVIIIAQSIGGTILTSLLDNSCGTAGCSLKWGTTAGGAIKYDVAYNLTRVGAEAFLDLSDWNTTIVAVVAAVVILTFVMLLKGKGPEAQ